MKRSKKVFGALTIIGIIVVVAIILINIKVNKWRNKQSEVVETQIANIEKEDNKSSVTDIRISQPGKYHGVHYYNANWGDGNAWGWCMQEGWGIPKTASRRWNMYTTVFGEWLYDGQNHYGELLWLCDNMIAYTNNETLRNNQLSYYKAYLKENYNIDVSGYSIEEIFSAEQYALWHYTNGHSYTNDTGKVFDLAKKFINEANKHKNEDYRAPKSNISIKAIKAYKKGNDTVAEFEVKNAINLKTGQGTIYTDSNLKNKYNGKSYIKNQHVYVKINNITTTKNVILTGEAYKTKSAYFYDCGAQQPILTMEKEKETDSASLHTQYSGSYSINMIKKSNTSNTALTDSSNALSGAEFEVKQTLNGQTSSSKKYSITTSAKTTTSITRGNVNITSDAKDTYEIRESATPNGYVNPLNSTGNPIDINLKIELSKHLSGLTYSVSSIQVYWGNNRRTLNKNHSIKIKNDMSYVLDSNTSDYIIAVNFDNGGNITIVWKNQETKDGTYNIKIAKKDDKSKTAQNNFSDALGGAEFTVTRSYKKIGAATSSYKYAPRTIVTNSGKETILSKLTTNHNGNITIDESNVDLVDIYDIRETKPPKGYENIWKELTSQYDDVFIRVEVYKKLEKTQYKIDDVKAYLKYTNTNFGGSFSIMDDNRDPGNVTLIGNTIYINIYDPEIKGNYNLNVVKQSNLDGSYDISKCISGAKFEVKQYVNKDINAALNGSYTTQLSAFNPSAGNIKVKFPNNNWNNEGDVLINYDGISYKDTYLIRETTPPDGYDLPKFFAENEKNYIAIEITKTEENGKLKIDKIDMYLEKYDNNYGYLRYKEISDIQRGKSKEYSDESISICAALNQDGTSITFYAKDPTITGQYDLYIGKKSTENYKNNNNGDFVENAQYSVTKYLNVDSANYINEAKQKNITIEQYLNSKSNILEQSKYTINTNKGQSTRLTENKITVNKTNRLYDYYIIKENKAPDNYTIDPNTYVALIEREVVGNPGSKTIAIKDVKVYNNNGTLIETNDETNNSQKTKTSKSVDQFKVYYTADQVTFVHADPPHYDGKYNMSIVKKDISDNSNGYEDNAQSGAQFEVKQYLNKDIDGNPTNNGHTSNNKNCVATEASKKSNIIYGNTNLINITDVTKPDTYTIKETTPPSGYEKSNLTLQFKVHKKKIGFDYVIDRVEVTNNGKSENVTIADGGSIKIDKDGNRTSNDATEYVVNIKFTETSIELIWKDYPTGQYKIKAKKVDTSGNALTDAKFKLTKGNDNNLFENDGKVLNTVEEKGYTSTYTQNVTKENVKDIDTYTLTELEAPNGYAKLKNPITLTITKNKTTYKMNQITVTADNGSKTQTIDFSTSQTVEKTLEDVLLTNDEKVKVTVSVDTAGIITIKVSNSEINGKYSLDIYKTVGGQPRSGVYFNILGAIGGTSYQTESNGHTRTLYKTDINKNNVTSEDDITIEELEKYNENLVRLQNKIHLKITKGENSSKTKYVVKHIKAWEEGKESNVFESDISETQPTTIMINNVTLTDGSTENLALKINPTNEGYQHINLEVENKEVQPKKYKIKIKKVNLLDPNTTISGRKFDIYKVNSNGSRELIADNIVTNNEGDAEVNREFLLEKAGIDNYVIQEVYDGVDNNYVKIENYEWKLNIEKVGTKLSEMTLGNYTISSQLISGKSEDKIQADIARQATVGKDSSENPTITITIPNQLEYNFKFRVRKVDLEDNELSGSKFTIMRSGNLQTHPAKSLTNIDPNDSRNNANIITTESVKPGEKYTFLVYEKEPPAGHLSLFKNTDGHVKVEITINSDGTVSGDITDWVNAIEETERNQYINEYLKKVNKTSILEINGNEVIVNLPNPENTTDFKFNLLKHDDKSKNSGVDNAKFAIRRYKEEDEKRKKTLDQLKTIFSSGTNVENLSPVTTSKSQLNQQIDSLEKVKAKTSYYYEICEEVTPTNYISTYKKAIVRINVDPDRNVSSEIIGILENKENADYIIYTKNNNSPINCETKGTEVNLSWENKLKYPYVVSLYKKQYKKELPTKEQLPDLEGLDGATFTVKQTSPVEKTIYDEEVLTAFQFFQNEDAISSTVYRYEIQENDSVEGYHNLFEGMTIILQVTIDKDGKIDKRKNATFIKIKDDDSIPDDKLKLAEDSMYLDINNNIDNNIAIYIANKQNIETYDLQILKVGDEKYDNRLIGIKDVGFDIIKSGENLYNENGDNRTNENGHLTITGLEIDGRYS